MAQKRISVIVEGGLVQSIYASEDLANPDLEIDVIDRDSIADMTDDEVSELNERLQKTKDLKRVY